VSTDLRILIVDDDPAVRGATQMLLKVSGYRATAVASLADALQHIQQQRPDLLLTDYHLSPGETGGDVLAALRRELGQSMKAVLLTGDTSAAIRELRADPNVRIASKPIQAEKLLTLIRELLDA
jgi:CheY-like chemotaxis protein